jgi:hypothetical protein
MYRNPSPTPEGRFLTPPDGHIQRDNHFDERWEGFGGVQGPLPGLGTRSFAKILAFMCAEVSSCCGHRTRDGFLVRRLPADDKSADCQRANAASATTAQQPSVSTSAQALVLSVPLPRPCATAIGQLT